MMPPVMKDEDILIFGHIHVPKMYKENNVYILNPGSISIPKEESKHSYGILEDKIFKLYDEENNLLNTYNMKED